MGSMPKEEVLDFLVGLDHFALVSLRDGMWIVALHSHGLVGHLIYKPGELPLHPVAESVISALIDLGADRVHVRYDPGDNPGDLRYTFSARSACTHDTIEFTSRQSSMGGRQIVSFRP